MNASLRATKIAVLLASILSVGSPLLCEAQDKAFESKPFAITEERNAAVGFALTQSLVTTGIANNCASLNDSALQDPGKVPSGWKQRNGMYVEASLGYLHYAATLIGSRKGQEEGKAFYRNAQSEIQKQAGLSLQDLFGARPPTIKKCEKLLGLMAEERMDLKTVDAIGNDNFMRALGEILEFHTWVMDRNKKRP